VQSTSIPPCRSASVTTPERERDPGAHRPAAASALALVEPDDLRRSAADIEKDRAFRLFIEKRGASLDGEPRLGAAVDDLQIEAELVVDPGKEVGAVRSPAAGLRSDQARACDWPFGKLLAADPKRRHRPIHCFGLQASVLGDALAQPDDP
jgi:hypothetical protein